MKFKTSKSMVIQIDKRCKNICEIIELVGAKLDYVSKPNIVFHLFYYSSLQRHL